MFIITEEFLKIFPKWNKAGWKAGDKLDLVEWLSLHPPKKPAS